MRAGEIQEIIETAHTGWKKPQAAAPVAVAGHFQGACRRSAWKSGTRSMGRREGGPGRVYRSAVSGKDFHRREQDDEQNDESDDFSGQAAGRFSVFAPGTSFRSVASAAFHAAGIARAAGRISVFIQMIGKEQFQFTDGGFHAGDDDAAVDGKSGQGPAVMFRPGLHLFHRDVPVQIFQSPEGIGVQGVSRTVPAVE
ncbi:hypothetical protein HMPREF3038_00812 [Akkermansia sp. KLE1797]|nr:hypothetical protein HMPREF3038_00812 [Akkermansia sp. KLE1797]KXU54533.1 hypothetical protein HMPREF3039_01430 [Akkermansia sp. KLE1798]KZA04925.1 hypothetical protein HMPREF1326_01507 [Akkermansia sp. KLE1605]